MHPVNKKLRVAEPKKRKVQASVTEDVPDSVPIAPTKVEVPSPKDVDANNTIDNDTGVETSHDDNTNADVVATDDSTSATFESLGLCSALCESCRLVKWTKPTDIQRETLPNAFAGRDVIGLAETGSGKTGAFVLPILQALLVTPQKQFALVLAPTRELAYQITETIDALATRLGCTTVTITGGTDMMAQAIALSKSPHIIVATPGRIVDHLENTKGFHLRSLRFLVLDEADRLLNMDFERELNIILSVIPKKRSTYLFSATMTSKVAKLQRASLTDPVRVEVSKKYQTVRGLIQQYIFIPAKYKDIYTIYILTELSGSTAIVFTSTCEHTIRLCLIMRALGIKAIPLHGQMTQVKRLGALHSFKSGTHNILVATDVASRGLDIPSVDCVLNYDIPSHSKDYIHRVGRTARAGRSGRAISIITQYDVELLQRIEELIQMKLELYQTEKDDVMMLSERVDEASRQAAMDMRERNQVKKEKKHNAHSNNSGGGGGGANNNMKNDTKGRNGNGRGSGGVVRDDHQSKRKRMRS